MLRFTLERLMAEPTIWWLESGDFIARFDRLPGFVQSAVAATYVGHWQIP